MTGFDWHTRAQFYREALLDDCVPFWLQHAPDEECGGWFFSLEHDGTVLDRDKPIWITARFTWLLATLAQQSELVAQVGESRAAQWRREASRGIAFLREHAFAEDADDRALMAGRCCTASALASCCCEG